MLSFFRRFTKSRYGLIVVFLFLGVIALAFMLGDITGMRNFGATTTSSVIAKVGDREITGSELRDRIDRALSEARAEGRQVTMADFIVQGGVEQVLDDLINSAVLIEYARKNGMVVSKTLIDKDIVNAEEFQGVDGKFSQQKFEAVLSQQRLSPQQVRDMIERIRYASWMLAPIGRSQQTPEKLVALQASALLERRKGLAGLVRSQDMGAIADPDDKTLTAYYNANRGRYMVPARRTIRYAAVKAEDVRARSTATEADIAEAYKSAGTRFAAKEKRDIRQLVLADQATANSVAAEAKGGKSLDEIAKAKGLETGKFDAVEKADLAKQASAGAAIADAAFGGAQGAVVGPVRSRLGWAVLRIEKVDSIAAKSLEQARTELAEEVTTKKTVAAIAALRQEIEDGIGDGMNFDELVAKAKLTVTRIGPVDAQGVNPEDPASKADPALESVVRAGFIGEQGDDPQLAPIGKDSSFALVAPERIIAAAAKPIASIRTQVVDDYRKAEQMKRAKAKAAEITKKINEGKTMAQAFTEAGLPVAFKAFDYVVGEVGVNGQPSPEVVASMQVPAKKSASFPRNDDGGVLVINITEVVERDATGDEKALARIRATVGPQIGTEHVVQFVESLRRSLKVTKNDAAVAKFKADIAGVNAR